MTDDDRLYVRTVTACADYDVGPVDGFLARLQVAVAPSLTDMSLVPRWATNATALRDKGRRLWADLDSRGVRMHVEQANMPRGTREPWVTISRKSGCQ
jgi:hypothetical protein